MKEIYLLGMSYVDGFDVLGVYTDYLKAEEEMLNLKRYNLHSEPEHKYHIYCLTLDKFYNYNEFLISEVN